MYIYIYIYLFFVPMYVCDTYIYCVCTTYIEILYIRSLHTIDMLSYLYIYVSGGDNVPLFPFIFACKAPSAPSGA